MEWFSMVRSGIISPHQVKTGIIQNYNIVKNVQLIELNNINSGALILSSW